MNRGLPYIVDVDRENPIGKLVGEYGDSLYWRGFGHGLFLGIVTLGASCFLGLYARSLRFRYT